jgi:hypothetical protein
MGAIAGPAVAACLAFLVRLHCLNALTERSRDAYSSAFGPGLAPRARYFRRIGHRTDSTCTDSGMLTLYYGDRIT